jgi:hypothetical protein
MRALGCAHACLALTPPERRPVRRPNRAGCPDRTAAAGVDLEIRPPPSVSTVGEHVYAMPSIPSLCFVFHPCPSSLVAPAI